MNFEFDIPFDDTEEPSTSTITVYNLSKNTRNSIKRGDPVIINAGYEGDIGCLFVGKIASLSYKKDPTDTTVKIIAVPALEEWLQGTVNKTYEREITAQDCLTDLLNIFGVEVSQFELQENPTYPRGKVCQGKLKDLLTEIVCSDCKSRMFIRPTGQLYINRQDSPVNSGYILSVVTGLLRDDDEVVLIPIEDEKNTETPPDEKEEQTVRRRCLLNHSIGTSDIITVESRNLNGRFIIVSGVHKGSQGGDFITELELKAV